MIFHIYIFSFLHSLIYFASADHLTDILLKFNDEDCVEGEIIENDGKLRLQTPLQLKLLNDEPQVVLNIAQKEAEALVEKPVIHEHPVSYVNRLANHNKIQFSYDVINKEGPQHKPTFYMKLTLGEEEYNGVGKNKKEAKKMAAVAAIENTQYLPPKDKSKKNDDVTPTASLNNIAQKLGIKVEYFAQGKNDFRLEKEAHYKIEMDGSYLQHLNNSLFYNDKSIPIEDNSNTQGPFKVIVSVSNQKFTGFGYSKKAARHDAATTALRSLKEQYENTDDICNHLECDKDLIKSPVSLLHEAAIKLGVNIEFDISSELGPDHKKMFTIQCTFDKYTSEGEGMSKKEAKRNAAYNMLHQLQTLSDIKPSTIINGILEKQKIKRKTVMDDVQKFIVNAKESFASMIQSLYNTVEGSFNNYEQQPKEENEDQKKSDATNFKDKLLRIGLVTKYNFYQSPNTHYAFVSLNTRPSYVCLGQGPSHKIAENAASFHSLKFIKKHKVLPAETTKTQVEESDHNVEYQIFDLHLESNDK